MRWHVDCCRLYYKCSRCTAQHSLTLETFGTLSTSPPRALEVPITRACVAEDIVAICYDRTALLWIHWILYDWDACPQGDPGQSSRQRQTFRARLITHNPTWPGWNPVSRQLPFRHRTLLGMFGVTSEVTHCITQLLLWKHVVLDACTYRPRQIGYRLCSNKQYSVSWVGQKYWRIWVTTNLEAIYVTRLRTCLGSVPKQLTHYLFIECVRYESKHIHTQWLLSHVCSILWSYRQESQC